MFCHLPSPYPDELLYSVIARYASQCAINSGPLAAKVFGSYRKPVVDLPGSLGMVAESTKITWGMTDLQIADRLTLFPFYTRYLPPERRESCLGTICSNGRLSVAQMLGLGSSGVVPPTHLRICPICRDEDIFRFGETWWRRVHQIPGVFVCPSHEALLQDSSAYMRPTGLGDFLNASDATADGVGEPLSGDGKLILVARRCQEILNGNLANWGCHDPLRDYHEAAMDRGFAMRGSMVIQKPFAEAISAFYRGTLLEKFVNSNTRTASSWGVTVFSRNPQHPLHPTRHAMLQVLIESLPITHRIRHQLHRGPWKCPNPYADHADDEFPIKSISKRLNDRGEYVATAKCSCGFKFTFQQTSDDNRQMPIVGMRLALGPFWAEEAVRQRNLGFPPTVIALHMGTNFRTIVTLLKKADEKEGECTGIEKSNYEELNRWKQEWLQTLDKVPERSRDLARKLNSPLYKKLRHHDPEWLYIDKPCRPARHWKPKINWEARDYEWARRLPDAIEKIKEETPMRRASPIAVFKRALLPNSAIQNLHRLPVCQRVLNDIGESVDDFRVRRLLAAERHLRDVGLPCTESRLKSAASLYVALSPRLRNILQDCIRRRVGHPLR